VATVLVADHEPEVAEMARRYLERAGMRALVTGGPAQTLRALASLSADLYVIDLTMPGLEVRAVRQALAPGAPVVFLLDRGDPRPHGLNSPPSVRRWFTRPFSPRALVIAVAGLLHPAPAQSRPGDPGGAGGPGGLIGQGRHDITVNGRVISLTRTEFVLVSALAQQPGRVLTRQRLLAALENERGKRPSARAVDVYIAQLRAKLGTDTIKTVHGVGYVLDLTVPLGQPADQSAGQRQGMAYALRRQTPGGSQRLVSREG
jgi:DNA-binding response OmpR family regulator